MIWFVRFGPLALHFYYKTNIGFAFVVASSQKGKVLKHILMSDFGSHKYGYLISMSIMLELKSSVFASFNLFSRNNCEDDKMKAASQIRGEGASHHCSALWTQLIRTFSDLSWQMMAHVVLGHPRHTPGPKFRSKSEKHWMTRQLPTNCQALVQVRVQALVQTGPQVE